MKNNENGVERGNETRFLRLVKVDWWSDSNEFSWRFIVVWNGNEDEEGLKEGFEKDEVIEGIRVNGGEFVGMQITWEIEWEGMDVEWWLSVKVKSGQTGQSIEHTRREGGDGVEVKCMRERELIDEKGNEDDWWKGIDE